MTITSKDPDQAPFGTAAGGGPPRRKFTRYAGSGAEMTATEKKMKNVDDDVAVEDFEDAASPGMAASE